MKLRGIWITIGLILVLGYGSTQIIRQYTSKPMALSEATSEETNAVTAAEAFAAAGESEATVEEKLSAVPSAREMPAAAAETGSEADIYIHLEEVDAQISRSCTVNADATANARKAAAENERKLWETELEKLLGKIEEKLSETEKEALYQEQKSWVRTRESTASEASKKQTQTTLQELDYNLSIKEATRARVYELAEEYQEILADEP